MKQVIVTGNIRNGKLELLDQAGFRRDIAITFDKDCIVDVIVERQGRKRTNQQNRYLWGIPYKLLSDYTGHSKDEIHEWCKCEFLSSKHLWIGEKEHEIGRSTSNLPTVEFEEYCENLRRFGATLGVNIPLPNENLEILNEALDLRKE